MDTIIGLGGGACVAFLGIYMLVSGDCRLLHGYHYATTPVAERPVLARENGACLIACGIGVAISIPSFLPDWTTAVGIVLIVLSLVGMFASIIRHNGGLITGGEVSYLSGLNPKVRFLALGLLGAALACAAIVPGAHMITTGDVSSLHDYHYAGVAAADLPRLATSEGSCMVGIGVSIFLCFLAAAGMVRRPFKRWAVVLMALGALLFMLSLVGLLLFIPYYGGSLTPVE